MKLAFVVPRFAEDIAGGAETLVRELAVKLQEEGKHQIEIFTTCAKDNRSWDNFYEPGQVDVSGLKTTRFLVDKRNLDAWVPLQIALNEGTRLDLDQELSWLEHSVNSSDLYKHLLNVYDDFDYFIYAPYLFGTTFWGGLMTKKKSLLLPCLHDESYAYLKSMQVLFNSVSGMIFNAKPEQELCERLYGKLPGGEVGMGFERIDGDDLEPYNGLNNYILYLGRKETGKNVHVLVDRFIEYKNNHGGDLKLVIAGAGDFSDLHRPEALKRSDIIDLGKVSEKEKYQLMKHALVKCSPSLNESFSIVIMEAWMLSTPVLVHEDSDVTKQHVIDSKGGMYFKVQKDFDDCINFFLHEKAQVSEMGQSGKKYVLTKYDWKAVLNRFDNVLNSIHAGN